MPDLIAVNGRIYTVDPAVPWVEALAVCGERIVRTGTSAEIEAIAAPCTRRLELAGRPVVPGFNDSHVHLIDGGTRAAEVDLRDATTPQEVRARLIAAYVRTQPKGRWILGGFWDHEAWPEKDAADARADRRGDAGQPGLRSAARRPHGPGEHAWRCRSPASRAKRRRPKAAPS